MRPVETPWLRFHVVSLILLGIYSLAYTTAAFVQFITEGEIQAILGQTRMRRRIEDLSGHTIIAGYGRVGALDVCALPGEGGLATGGIIAAAGGEAVPQAWIDQLAEGGRIVAPMVTAAGQQALVVIEKTAGELKQTVLEAVHFVPLKSGIA